MKKAMHPLDLELSTLLLLSGINEQKCSTPAHKQTSQKELKEISQQHVYRPPISPKPNRNKGKSQQGGTKGSKEYKLLHNMFNRVTIAVNTTPPGLKNPKP